MHGSRALIADDHELFSWALQSLLIRDLGFDHVQLVTTLDDALQALSNDPSKKLLCLDLSMPGMNGFEGVRRIKAAAPPDLSIVIVTASSRRDDVAEAIRTGVNGYVLKTMRTPEIAEAIRKVMEGGAFIPSMLAQQSHQTGADRRLSTATGFSTLTAHAAAESAPIRRWSELTKRQSSVGELIIHGRSNKQIAIDMGLAEGTVKVHVAALFRSLNVRNRTEAVAVLVKMRDAS